MAPMTAVETNIKKQTFANLLFDANRNLTRHQVAEIVGISLSTYDKWAKDPGISEMVIPESWRINKTTEILLRSNQANAVMTLIDVMENGDSAAARVRAAEVMLKYGKETANDSNGNDADIVRILAQNKPIFVNGNLIFNGSNGDGETDVRKQIEEAIVETDFTVVDDEEGEDDGL